MREQALSGLKVLDLSRNIAGPYCTKMLADLGAEVIKIEQPGKGDPSRKEGPFPNDEPNHDASGLFGYLNNNKIGITLDLKSERGVEIIKTLVRDADVLVENFSPRVMPSLGLSYDVLKEINPNLVMTSISNFGQQGDYRDFKGTELITQAMSGFAYQIGDESREPLRAGGALRMMEYISGAFASMSTLAAIAGRRNGNKGKHVDVSITECAVLQTPYRTVQNSFPSSPSIFTKRYVTLPSIEKCKDGYIGISILTGKQWQDFCCMTEMYDWVEDPRFMELFNRIKHRDEFRGRVDKWLMEHTKEEIFKLGVEWRVPITAIPTFGEMLDFPQYKEREFFVSVNHPIMGEVVQPGAPYRLSETPWEIRKPAPLLGEDNAYLFGEILGFTEEEIQLLDREGVI
ncbi:CaiB/BaiF CoA transferase family protein [Peribacillus sp. NPDC097295]|uniref:CaiB/BaiF CoA transferase family protein n=1 Tax=Peribacillus sp. NPDC097295 TaxID=3364402 RepID=UPI00381C0E6A